MRGRAARRFVLLLALPFAFACGGRCASSAKPDPTPRRPNIVHRGEDRSSISYRERAPEAKAALLARINRERADTGAPPVRYDLLGAKVGDEFCLDSATGSFVGHWDRQGRAPYLRYTQAGGVDYHAQNFASHSRTGYPMKESIEQLLFEGHDGMMAERPPDDGHRRVVLDPLWTHVGIGAALVGGEFRMTEEFSRQIAEWVELPDGPLPPRGFAPFGARFPRSWKVGVVEIAWEPPPSPLSKKEIAARGAYAYPKAIHSLRPLLAPGSTWSDGSHGDFELGPGGRVELPVALDHGPGSYYVIVYVGRSLSGELLQPAVAARIEAR